MPPLLSLSLRSAPSPTSIDFSPVREQWQNPSDIFTILMIIGGDIVQRALAQLASSHPRPFIPIAFSFGWVAYAFSAILSAVGSHRLAPEPDCDCTLIDVATGYSRHVNSWNLARLVRDYRPNHNHSRAPSSWNPARFIRDHKSQNDAQRGLTVVFLNTSDGKCTGVPDQDWVYYMGLFIIVVQLAIAVVPGVLFGNWLILILTFGGIVLIQVQGGLPQWREEMWAARKVDQGKREDVCLTKGNGSALVIVIRSEGCGLRLADLAGAREQSDDTTKWATFALALLWLVHLFTMQSLEENSWFLLGIGLIGMLQNVVAAGARRTPAALGFHFEKNETIHEDKVIDAIKKAEEYQAKAGLVLLDTFFPGGLRPNEEAWKRERIELNAKNDKEKKGQTTTTATNFERPGNGVAEKGQCQ
ncbi:hypothetical protein VKT23_013181 [Stygiomarasmius scandens]|uniref:Uncharacterized protein n=1 Tax=Marasmiellus scandens TaxID=2682957 RepID=A0ABR1J3U1_9AGAR